MNLDMSTFLNMGGYGTYVWLAYGVVASIFLANVIGPQKRHRSLLKTIKKRLEQG